MASLYEIWMHRVREEATDIMASEEEQNALLDYLNENAPANEAASRYTKSVATSDDQETVYIWSLLQDVAEEFPETHERLIELLKAITDLPTIERDSRVIESYGLVFWRDLPDFVFELRENIDGLQDFGTRSPNPPGARRFINLCGFNARANHQHLLPLTEWGLKLCSEAFEHSYDGEADKLNVLLSAAGQYLLLSTSEMYESGTKDQYADMYAGPLLKQRREASAMMRWNLWQERLVDFEKDSHLDESARVIATQARERMAGAILNVM